MKNIIFCGFAVSAVSLGLIAMGGTSFAQPATKGRSTIAQSLTPPAFPLSKVADSLIEFPLPKGEEAYGSINGRKMHKYVEELAQISLRYRDNGHPKFWGRLIGTPSETETNE